MMSKEIKGSFIVIEGTDGSGKGTQVRPLAEYLQRTNQPCETVDFPRYTDNIWGEMVGRYLRGEFGGLREVNPYMASLPYIFDRVLAAPIIKGWLEDGKIVIANRYMQSNLGFQAAKLPHEQRQTFIDWEEKAEYEVHGIPREDVVVLLNVTPDIGQKNVDKKEVRDYMGEKGRDIHEADLDYQREVAGVYLGLGRERSNWRVIECIENGLMRAEMDIHQEIVDVLRNDGFIK